MEARRSPTAVVVGFRRCVRTIHCVCGKRIHRGARRGVLTDCCPKTCFCWPRGLVLSAEAGVSFRSDLCLPTLDDQSVSMVAVFVSGGRHCCCCGRASAVSAWSRTTDELSVFHRNAFPRSGIFQRLPFSVLLGCGSFSIPREPWHPRSNRVGCKSVAVAIDPVESSDGGCSSIVVSHAGRVDLASEWFL